MSLRAAIFLLISLLSHALFAEEIIIGLKTVQEKRKALIFSPLVFTEPFSFKLAFEYKLSDKTNLILPLEAQWMDYRWLIRLFDQSFPEDVYNPKNLVRPEWNFDYSHFKIASGLGLKIFPISKSMTNAFFLKVLLMLGYERFNAHSKEEISEGAIIIQSFSMGYSWVKGDLFTIGLEAGVENTFHSNPMKNMPLILPAFHPMLQLNMGFIF